MPPSEVNAGAADYQASSRKDQVRVTARPAAAAACRKYVRRTLAGRVDPGEFRPDREHRRDAQHHTSLQDHSPPGRTTDRLHVHATRKDTARALGDPDLGRNQKGKKNTPAPQRHDLCSEEVNTDTGRGRHHYSLPPQRLRGPCRLRRYNKPMVGQLPHLPHLHHLALVSLHKFSSTAWATGSCVDRPGRSQLLLAVLFA